MFKVMKPYQWERLLGFLHPFKHPTGSGWNLIQALIAVGSGRVLGKGLFQGGQTTLQFVPQHATDFIFTVVAEQLGWIGSFFLLLLYFSILWYGTKIALETEDKLGKLLACGIVSLFLVHIVINIGMTIGIMPITGIPLPFISSAGTSLIVNLICIALLLNIEYERTSLIQ
jgi:rod shape determining protein RodA